MEVGKRDYNQLWEANDKTKKLDEIKVAYSTLYIQTLKKKLEEKGVALMFQNLLQILMF